MNVTPNQAVMQAHSAQDCVNAIGEALHGTPNGKGGFNLCDCPVHGGHECLSVDLGNQPGTVTLYCHSCGKEGTPAIIEAIKQMGLPWPGPASPSFALSPEQAEARRREQAEKQREQAEKEARMHAAAAEEAARIFKQASPDWREHPYAKKKGAVFGGLDQNPQRTVFKNPRRGTLPGEDEQNPLVKDAILFPLKEHLLGDVQTLLAIAPNGRKFLLKGGKKKGCFYFFNSFHDNPPVLYIGEGVATVGAVWRATGGPCIAAGDAGNMVEIAKRVRQPAPRGIGLPWKREIIILADEDVGGLAAAAKAARLAGGKIARPQAALDTDAPKRYDFWDLWHEHQESAVRLALSKAEPPPPESAKKKEASPLPASFAPSNEASSPSLDGADAPGKAPSNEAPPPSLDGADAPLQAPETPQNAQTPEEDDDTSEADIAPLRETVDFLAGLPDELYLAKRQIEAKERGIPVKTLDQMVRARQAWQRYEEEEAGRQDDPEVEGEGLPKDFHLHQSGLWHYHVQTPEEAAKTGITMQDPPARTFIGPPLLVVAGVRDLQSDNWSKLLQWHDRKGVKHQWVLPDKLLHAKDPAVWIAPLASGGWSGATNKAAKELLKLYLISCRPPDNTVCVSRTGWHRGAYVFPNDETLYPADSEETERFVLQTNRPCNNPFAQKGSLEAWQATIGKWAQGNSRLVLALSAALAATLLEVCGLESGGFHLVGTSSEGKTTVLFAAASVWGPGNREGGYIRSWRATDNGLEGTAALHSDALLCLDEIGQAPARVIEEAAYMLANGTGKGRARQDGTAREAQNWRCLILSTGEESLVDCIRAGGGRVKAGQQVRLLDIPATADMSKPDWGIVENLHGHEDTKGFIHAVEDAAKEAYGTAAQAFIRKVQEHGLTELAQFWRRYREATLERLTGKNASGQVKRAGERFLLCAFAGEKATEWGILPWKKGEAMKGVQTCFRAWIAQRGGKGAAEDLAIVQQVRLFLEQHGSSRFQDFDSPDEKCLNRAGFKEKHGDTLRFFVLPEVFKRELVPGYDHKRAGKVLYEAGILEKPEDPQAQMQRMTLPGMGRQRCYVLSLPQADREKED